MWNLYIVPAIRHIMKNRGFTLINVTGLSFGPAACLLIFSFITHEMSYDGFLPDIGRLYRV